MNSQPIPFKLKLQLERLTFCKISVFFHFILIAFCFTLVWFGWNQIFSTNESTKYISNLFKKSNDLFLMKVMAKYE